MKPKRRQGRRTNETGGVEVSCSVRGGGGGEEAEIQKKRRRRRRSRRTEEEEQEEDDDNDADDDDDAGPSSTQLARRVSCIMPSCNAYLIQGQLYYSPRLYTAYIATENKSLRNRAGRGDRARGCYSRTERGGIKLLPRLFQAMISLPA